MSKQHVAIGDLVLSIVMPPWYGEQHLSGTGARSDDLLIPMQTEASY